jgi:hypothetical protein
MFKNLNRTVDEQGLRAFIVGAALALIVLIGSCVTASLIPFCLGLSACFVGCWPLVKRLGLVAFTGRYSR